METKEAFKSHNQMQKEEMIRKIEDMIEDAKIYGEQRKTIKMAILENEFIDEDEQKREDFIQTNIVKINVVVEVETI